jgi:hypothetical protein
MKRWLAAALGITACVWLSAASGGCGAREDILNWYEGSGGAVGTGTGAGAGTGTATGTATGTDTGTGTGMVTVTGVGTSASGAGGAGTTNGSGPGNTVTAVASGPGAGAGGASVICPDFGSDCTECLSTDCPAVYCECYNNPDCFALAACFDSCNDDEGCNQLCMATHEGGIADLYLLSDCASTVCPFQCPGNNDLPLCTECIFESCEDEMNACLAEAECLVLYNCLDACGNVDLGCQQDCYAAHGGGVPSLQKVLECMENLCPNEC